MFLLAGDNCNSVIFEKAVALGKRLGLETVSSMPEGREDEIHLFYGEEGLSLRQGELSLRGDFTEMLPRLGKKKVENEMSVKAAKLSKGDHPLIFDATAGLGEDSFIFAAAGFHVVMYEYDPIIFALLEDSVSRALCDRELKYPVSRMEINQGDSISALKAIAEGDGEDRPDVIFLDPMFPARTKSADVGKKFQLLQQLESPCSDGEDLLYAAIRANPKKIVIKRPAKGEFLGGIKPDFSFEGKAVRYDCLIKVSNYLKHFKTGGGTL